MLLHHARRHRPAACDFRLLFRFGDRADRASPAAACTSWKRTATGPPRNVNRLVANRERLIGALLLGNTFINILASSLTTRLWRRGSGLAPSRSPPRS